MAHVCRNIKEWRRCGLPDQVTWLHRVPEILAALEEPSAPVILDRPAVEALFGVRRRQAIRILGACGGYRVGKTYVAGRKQVAAFVRRYRASGAVAFAVERKERILEEVNEARRNAAARRVSIPVTPALESPAFARLPGGIELRPGVLTIRFDEPVELLQKLFAFSQALSADFEEFQRLLSQ